MNKVMLSHTAFLGAVLIGALSMLAGLWLESRIPFAVQLILTTLVPVILILGYLWVGWTTSSDVARSESFADSVYFLGFLFTLIALVLSLVSYGSGDGSAMGLEARFATALVTTIVGLVIRIMLVNLGPNAEEDLEKSRRAFQRSSQALRVNLEELTTLTVVMSKEYETVVGKSIGDLGRMTQGLTKAGDALSTSVGNSIVQFGKFNAGFQDAGGILKGSTEEYVTQLGKTMKDAQERLSGAGESLSSAIGRVAKHMVDESSKGSAVVSEAFAKFAGNITKSGEAGVKNIEAVYSSIIEQSDVLKTKLEAELNAFPSPSAFIAPRIESILAEWSAVLRSHKDVLGTIVSEQRAAVQELEGARKSYGSSRTSVDEASLELTTAMTTTTAGVTDVGRHIEILNAQLKKLEGDLHSHHDLANGQADSLRTNLAAITNHEKQLEASVNKSRQALKAVQDHMVEAAHVVVRSLNSQ